MITSEKGRTCSILLRIFTQCNEPFSRPFLISSLPADCDEDDNIAGDDDAEGQVVGIKGEEEVVHPGRRLRRQYTYKGRV